MSLLSATLRMSRTYKLPPAITSMRPLLATMWSTIKPVASFTLMLPALRESTVMCSTKVLSWAAPCTSTTRFWAMNTEAPSELMELARSDNTPAVTSAATIPPCTVSAP